MPLFVKIGTKKSDIDDSIVNEFKDKFVIWCKDLKAQGISIESGSFRGKDMGMTVLQASTYEEASKIFESDPFNEILESWEVNQWDTIG